MSAKEFQTVLENAYVALDGGALLEAKDHLQQARKLDPDHRDVGLLEIDLLDSEGLGEEAVLACEDLLHAFDDDLLVQYRHATLLLDTYEDVEHARPLLEEVFRALENGAAVKLAGDAVGSEDEQASFRLDLLLTLADCRTADGDVEGAFTAASSAVSLNPSDPMAHITLATIEFEGGKLENSLKNTQKAADLEPLLPDAHWLKGRILTMQGAFKEADEAFQRAVTSAPDRFTMPFKLKENIDVSELLERGFLELPNRLAEYMRQLQVEIEDLPSVERLSNQETPMPPSALAALTNEAVLAQDGVEPLSVWPQSVTVYRRNLEIASESEEELIDLMIDALLHEVAYFFGQSVHALVEEAAEDR